MATYVYRPINGKVQAVQVSTKRKHRGTPDFAKRSFHANVLDAYRQVEESGKWQGPYAKAQVKKIHENAMARDAVKGIGVET